MSDINKLSPQVQMPTQQQLQQPQQQPFIYIEGTTSKASTLVKTAKYQMPEPASSFWLYTFPSYYHPLIVSDNLEFWTHYQNIVNDEHSDYNTRNNHINYLKEMMILKKTTYPKAAMVWITILFILYLLFCLYTDANVIGGFVVYGISIIVCIIWNIFAKRSGKLNWDEFINIANGNESMAEKKNKFEKERDAANNLQIARESRSNRSSVGSNLGAAVVGYFLGQSRS
jgi:hypothetical protein